MDHDHNSGKDVGNSADERPGRGWTERFGPIRYRRFTDVDAGGRPSIFFKFELSPGQSEMPKEVWDILHSLRQIDRGPTHGGGRHYTGLQFNRSKKHGRVWRLPDSQTGRTAADIIDARLADLITKIEEGKDHGR